jgi:hypothetical protein
MLVWSVPRCAVCGTNRPAKNCLPALSRAETPWAELSRRRVEPICAGPLRHGRATPARAANARAKKRSLESTNCWSLDSEGAARKTLTPHPKISKKRDPLDLASKGSQTRNRGPRKIGGPTGYQGDHRQFRVPWRGGDQKSAPQRRAHFTGTFLTFPASK